MKAVEISAPGGPEVLKLTERPVPQPQTNEVLVRVAAAGVNGPDIMQRKGLYPAAAGRIRSAGARDFRRSRRGRRRP